MKVFSGWRRYLFCLPILIFFLHIISVFELQQNPASHKLQPKHKKFDHLVLGPSAGEGLRDRLQCRGTKALSETNFSTSSRRYNFGDNVAFVTVFATYKSVVDEQKDLTTVGDITYTKVERSMAVLNVFINFIQITMPQSEVIILSDPSSELMVRRDRVIVHPIPGEYSRDKLMLQRIRSYIAFLRSRLQEHSEKNRRLHHYIFTDSDIAVVDNLGNIFDDFTNFDVALTFRNNKQQPLNSGFIAVKGTIEGITRAKVFLQEVLQVYTSRYMKASRMLGDQLALAWVVKSHPSFDAGRFTRKEPFLDKIGGTLVLFLPCLSYNWTPPEGAGQFRGMPLDVKIVHFKGSRKRLMLESWNYLNSSSSSQIPDMLCLILKSGRTKYDF
ncbi:phosphatase [Lithospermum erythrorhizon]|uniref:Phosphatase n=1 Tax=Lithospermum erythrorhizon TaxID=34254 RepID=A0AAV3NXB2_LITER